MKKSLLLVCIFTIISNAQNTNIKKSIDIFFEGLNQRDTLKIKSVCLPNFTLQTIEEKGIVSNLLTISIQKFFESLAVIPKSITIEERILEHKLYVDGTMAIAWLPYEFYFNEKIHHSGVNVFTMFKDSGTWKIVSITDTRREVYIKK